MPDPLADVASAIALGRRDRQEDAVLVQFPDGGDGGFAVLADGMGGHDDGDLAAQVIVSQVFAAFSLTGRSDTTPGPPLPDRLRHAVRTANRGLRDHVEAGLGQVGMGGTVILSVVQGDALSWISVGDSGLWLFRDGRLVRLNEVHSLAPQIDLMVQRGEMDADTARRHPQRGCLTSALVGADIQRVDCPAKPFALRPGDIVLMASDGIEVLPEAQLARLLRRHRRAPSQRIAAELMQAVHAAAAEDQDNVSLIVIKPGLAARAPVLPRLSDLCGTALSGLLHRGAAVLTGRSAL
ncbi:PP2C family protein-serine/threonine phosphatase [Pseudoponticoccus marisrubri]|uniref:PP2C family protein-serine/threonine phosphatase n=1 Tax=Pseudoponticoccus marisrubri TaxID=1685382 RepID=UPI0012FD2BEA|nr:protein phosphatase 2C domain-containing protein [Pseudoponticoccus marisrubri]